MRRGEIYFVRMPSAQGSCQQGLRPVVIVSSEAGCRTNGVVMVCPITTKQKPLSCNVTINWSVNGAQSQVLCNQITTVSQDTLQDYVGSVSTDEQRRISIAMLISLGIKTNYDEVII